MRFGLIGEKLAHSYSPSIHKRLGEYEYGLYELKRGDLATFLKETDLDGFNVTIPFKKDIADICSELSETAKEIGSVNTVIKTKDGWYGDNTDYFGFCEMLRAGGIDCNITKAIILGSGGASLAVQAALKNLGVRNIVVISRNGDDNYGNIERHADAELIVNTTPVGMYPRNGERIVELSMFSACKGAVDLIYNPLRTDILLQAEELGIKNIGGITMLVAQAAKSAELFTGMKTDEGLINKITRELIMEKRNIALIGMPGSGKSTVGRNLAEETGRTFIDIDKEIEKKTNRRIEDIFNESGEACFRKEETAVLEEVAKRSGCVISCGGGIVTRKENYRLLRQNSLIVWILRDLDSLDKNNRPLSQKYTAKELFEERKTQYEFFADIKIENTGTVSETTERIVREIYELDA